MSNQTRIAAALSLDGLGGDARATFDLAMEAGYGGVALPTNHPELTPTQLGDSARRHLRNELARRGLAAQVVRAAGPRAGLTDTATLERTMDNTRQAIQLAYDLGAKTVSLNAGPLGGVDVRGRTTDDAILEAARQLATEADKAGITLAFAADSDEKLQSLLRGLNGASARANIEPAQTLSAGIDPLNAMTRLAGLIGEVTFADVVDAGWNTRAVEIGTGQVPWRQIWAMLAEQGFRGPMVVDVRDVAQGQAAAQRAADVIRQMTKAG